MLFFHLDGRFGLSEFDRFRKKWSTVGGTGVDSNTNVRGSLDRRTSYATTNSSGILNAAENRYSWSSDEYAVDGFRPVTLTVNGFFKQVFIKKNFIIIKVIILQYFYR